jgi:hypothetical protein
LNKPELIGVLLPPLIAKWHAVPCVCVCVCVFVCTCACTSLSSSVLLLPPLIAKWHAVPYIYIYIYIHIYIHVCVWGGMRCHLYSLCLCVCVCVCVYNTLAKISIYACVYICGSCGFVCVCIYTIYTQYLPGARRNTHTHTHTHAPLTTQHFTGARRRQVAAATPGGTHSQKCSQKCLSLVNMQRTYSKVLSKAPTYSKHLKALTF